MPMRILLIISYMVLVSFCFYYKAQNALLNSRLDEIKLQSQIKQRLLEDAEKQNKETQKHHDKKVERIKTAQAPSDCPSLIDWMVEQIKQ